MIKVNDVYITANQNKRIINLIENNKVTVTSEFHQCIMPLDLVEELIQCKFWQKSFDVENT